MPANTSYPALTDSEMADAMEENRKIQEEARMRAMKEARESVRNQPSVRVSLMAQGATGLLTKEQGKLIDMEAAFNIEMEEVKESFNLTLGILNDELEAARTRVNELMAKRNELEVAHKEELKSLKMRFEKEKASQVVIIGVYESMIKSLAEFTN